MRHITFIVLIAICLLNAGQYNDYMTAAIGLAVMWVLSSMNFTSGFGDSEETLGQAQLAVVPVTMLEIAVADSKDI